MRMHSHQCSSILTKHRVCRVGYSTYFGVVLGVLQFTWKRQALQTSTDRIERQNRYNAWSTEDINPHTENPLLN